MITVLYNVASGSRPLQVVAIHPVPIPVPVPVPVRRWIVKGSLDDETGTRSGCSWEIASVHTGWWCCEPLERIPLVFCRLLLVFGRNVVVVVVRLHLGAVIGLLLLLSSSGTGQVHLAAKVETGEVPVGHSRIVSGHGWLSGQALHRGAPPGEGHGAALAGRHFFVLLALATHFRRVFHPTEARRHESSDQGSDRGEVRRDEGHEGLSDGPHSVAVVLRVLKKECQCLDGDRVGGTGMQLTLSIRIALVRAIPVINMLQLKRLMRDSFCDLRRGARMRTGIGREMR